MEQMTTPPKDYRDEFIRELEARRAYVVDQIRNPRPGSTVHTESGWIGLQSEIDLILHNLRRYA